MLEIDVTNFVEHEVAGRILKHTGAIIQIHCDNIMTKVILYIATSLDGFIADENGDVDWLPHPSDENDEFGHRSFMKRISIIIMGSRSYQQILSFGDWTWGNKTTYVFTSKALTTDQSDIFFITNHFGCWY